MTTLFQRWLVALALIALVYFVFYPADLAIVLAPVEKMLGISNAVSPWLYGVIGVGIAAWALVRVFGEKKEAAGTPPPR